MNKLAIMLAVGAAVWSSAAAAERALLKPSVQVEGDVVRLGDLFDNAGPKAAAVVTHAPQPGRRVVLDAEWLAAVAKSFGLDWQPLGRMDRVSVERRSVTVGTDDIAAELKRALMLQGMPADAEMQLANRALQVHVPADGPYQIDVRDVDYEPQSGRFTAFVEIASSAGPQRMRLSGRSFTMAQIPVLARPMQKGEVITEKDLDWLPVRADQIGHGVLTDIDQVVGQAVRNAGRAGQPLRRADVQIPVVVPKGALVTMVLQSPGMALSAQGRAIEDGGAGQTIRVTNTHSKMTVEARVEGPGIVSVLPTAHVLAN